MSTLFITTKKKHNLLKAKAHHINLLIKYYQDIMISTYWLRQRNRQENIWLETVSGEENTAVL